MKTHSTIIIGAGLCGLTCFKELEKLNLKSSHKSDVLILEKSSGVGGRMATRRFGGGKFDHGAQFYKSSEMSPFLYHSFWKSTNKSNIWFTRETVHYFKGVEGMNSLAKALSENMNIEFEQKVVEIKDTSLGIVILTESNQQYLCKNLILTMPLPQTLQLLKHSYFSFEESLGLIKYAKALVGLLRIDTQNATEIFMEKFIQIKGDIFSISNNQSKGISPHLDITVVMSEEFSEKYFDEADEVINKLIVDKTYDYFLFGNEIKFEIKTLSSQIKKWRYSHSLSHFPEKFCFIAAKNSASKIFLVGDAFGGSGLKGTVLSAQTLTESEHFKL